MTTESIILSARWGYFCAMWRDIGKAHALPFTVLLWSVDPDVDGNDPDMGADFATRDEAIACYRALVMFPTTGHAERSPDSALMAKNYARHGAVWSHVMIDGPGVHEVTAQPDRKALAKYKRALAREDAAYERECRAERAMQAGMAFGSDGYNDEMGY